MALIDDRRAQMFPTLTAAQVDVARHFASGEARRFAAGETIYDVGQVAVPSQLVLEGSIEILQRDGLGHESLLVTLDEGQFSGEINQLHGRATLAAARAGADGCL